MKRIAGSSSDEPPIQFDGCMIRASKRLIKDAGDINQLPDQSTLEVESSDDLLIEILLRLPFISLCSFKSVSKRWISLIRRLNFTRPSGVFIQGRTWPRHESLYGCDFLPFDVSIPKNITTFPFGSFGKILIRQSCNGFLLCQQMETHTYYVYNPTIKQFKKLPRCRYGRLIKAYGWLTMRMAFDPTKSPHYTVVSITSIRGISIQLQTYSSETCKWRVCGDQFSCKNFVNFDCGIYWNGAIHWIESDGHYKLDVEHPLLTSLPTPFNIPDGEVRMPFHKLCVSRGSLILIRFWYERLDVYEMKNGYSKWFIKYNVDLEDVMWNEGPQTRGVPLLHESFLCFVEGEREHDTFLVLNLYGNVITYNIMLRLSLSVLTGE